MIETKFINEYAPYLLPFLAAIVLIIFTKKYLFTGMISAEMHREQLKRECEMVKIQEEIASRLEEIADKLEGIEKLLRRE